jgi:mannose-6-phosphate isomerase-like protein (cupin superfamily)
MTHYEIHNDVKFAPLELVDLHALAVACAQPWWNQSLCLVNGCVVRLGVFLGEFHWHRHECEDEYFQVLEGELKLDLEGRTLSLTPGQAVVVPRGVVHRTRAAVRTVALMIEGAGVQPEGD